MAEEQAGQQPGFGLWSLPREVLEHALVHRGGARAAAMLACTCRELRAMVMGERPGEGILCREDDLLPENIGSIGGVVAFHGVLQMTRAVVVEPGVALTIRGPGRLENASDNAVYQFEPHRLRVMDGGSLTLEDVVLEGTGVEVMPGGTARLARVEILRPRTCSAGMARHPPIDTRLSRARAAVDVDVGGELELDGVTIQGRGQYTTEGISVSGHAAIKNTRIERCEVGVRVIGRRAKAEVTGGLVLARLRGISVSWGGEATLADALVKDEPSARQVGVVVVDKGSKATVTGGALSCIKVSGGGHVVVNHAQVRPRRASTEERCGDARQVLVVSEPGSKAVVTGGSVGGGQCYDSVWAGAWAGRGDGVCVWGGGHVVLAHVAVGENQGSGIFVHGEGSRAEVTGGSVRGSKEHDGIDARGGGYALVKGVRVEDNQQTGVSAFGQGSRVEVKGGSVTGSKVNGISAAAGGHALVMKGVRVEDNQQTGVFAFGQGSRVEVKGGSVTGSKVNGISAAAGGHALVKGVRVTDNRQTGVLAFGQGSRVEVDGGSVTGSKVNGIDARGSGYALVKGVRVEDNQHTGVLAFDQGSRVEVEGGSVTGSKVNGIGARGGGYALVKGVRVEDNQQTGVLAFGQGSRVEVEGGSVTGSRGSGGIRVQYGGHAVVTGVRVED